MEADKQDSFNAEKDKKFPLLSSCFAFQQLREQLNDGSLSLLAAEKGQLWVSMPGYGGIDGWNVGCRENSVL